MVTDAPVPLAFELNLSAHPRMVAVARDAVDVFAGYCSRDQLETARILFSELVTNSIVHANLGDVGRIRVCGTMIDGVIHGKVLDDGPPFERSTAWPEPGTLGGYGLHIVAATARAWGIRRDVGNEVWFEV